MPDDTAPDRGTDPRDRPEIRYLRRRAYEELNAAIDKAGPELAGDWLARGDPDLRSLRQLDEPEWQLLVRRSTGKPSSEDPQFPGPAWGDPHRRRNEWIGVAAVWAVLGVLALVLYLPGWEALAAGLVLFLCAGRSIMAARSVDQEARLEDERSIAARWRRDHPGESRPPHSGSSPP